MLRLAVVSGVLLIGTLGALPLRGEEDVLIADFEGQDYGEWQVTGDAFGTGPASGTLANQMPVEGFAGQRLVNSFTGGDAATGTLTSPEFEINRRYLRFLIGGGGWSGETCLNLVIDGRVVQTATGQNTVAGGSERLEPAGWDVSEWLGRRAQLVVVDQHRGGWGHINVDDIVLTDQKPPLVVANASREFTIAERYLNFPVKNGGTRRKVTVRDGENLLQEFDIELADEQPDWWAPLDVAGYRGRQLIVSVDRLRESSLALNNIRQSDALLGADDLYRERLRPLVHFTARRGWNNDPNGLVFYQGEYHLFFQHNPYGTSWGNMHWGHAISQDLIRWEELGESLYPDALGPMFSGSAVIDWHNTSGLQSGNEPPLILLYTAAGNPAVQCLAYSNDRGRSFTKYPQNPILKNISPGNRDPKVIWHEPTKRWIMVLYVEPENKQVIQFFESKDLKHWQPLSQVDGFFECPDLFPLDVDGDSENTKWILTAASSEYMVGSFDGREFRPESQKLPGHRGNAFYAAQTYSDIPASDGRRIQIGWGQMPAPQMPFNQMMCLPCELSLRSTDAGPRLSWRPVREFDAYQPLHQISSTGTLRNEPIDLDIEGEALDATFAFETRGQIEVEIRGVRITIDGDRHEVRCLDRVAPIGESGKLELRAIIDRTSLEIFADGGLVYMPLAVIPDGQQRRIQLRGGAGPGTPYRATVRSLGSIWE